LEEETESEKKGELRIAWRYENSSANQISTRNVPIFGHTYDLSSRGASPLTYYLTFHGEVNYWTQFPDSDRENYELHMIMFVTLKQWEVIHLTFFSFFCVADLHNYDTLYDYIRKVLEDRKYDYSLPSENRTVLRIGIVSLGTGLWIGNIYAFLIKLRYLLRNFGATCFISIQPKLFEVSSSLIICVPLSVRSKNEILVIMFQNTKDVSRIEHLCDAAIQLKSLLNEGNPIYKDYDGLVILKKLPSMSSWAPVIPETNDWAFKLRKTRFIVEVKHSQYIKLSGFYLLSFNFNFRLVESVRSRPIWIVRVRLWRIVELFDYDSNIECLYRNYTYRLN